MNCSRCDCKMKSYTRSGRYNPNLAIENNTVFLWVCVDCNKCIKGGVI